MKHNKLMDMTTKEKLIKRLQYLWTWELFDTFFLPAVFVWIVLMRDGRIGIFTIYSLLCLDLILWQGVAYWRLKLEAVRRDQPIDPYRLRPFQAWKKINWLVLGLLPFVLLIRGFLAGGWQFNFELWAGAFLYLLAFLEQVNYFYYQLMYDYPEDWKNLVRNRKLKKASLRRALESRDETQ